MTSKIYDDPLAGTLLWEETQMVTVTGGLYSVDLGAGTAFGATLFSGPRWLGIAIASDPEMTPRYPLVASPYAINAVRLGGKLPSDFAAASHDHALTGDVTGTLAGSQVVGLRGVGLSTTPPTDGQVLRHNGTAWEPFSLSVGTVTQVDTGPGLAGGPITTTGTVSLDLASGGGLTTTGGLGISPAGIVPSMVDAGDYSINILGTAATATNALNLNGQPASAYALAGHTHASNPLVSDVVAVSGTTATSSTSDEVVPGMTLTPAAGTYLVWFATAGMESSNRTVYFSLYAGDTKVDGSEIPSAVGAYPTGISVIGKVTVNGTQAIEIHWRVTGGTATAYSRTMTILKVQ